VLLAAGSAAGAQPGFHIRHVDVGSYPLVTLVVKAPGMSSPPPVYENGARVHGVEAQSLGQSKEIVLAVDRSKSMAGKPLEQAGAAVEGFLRRKPASDQVGIVTFGTTALTQAPIGQATIDADAALRTLSSDPVEGTALYDAVVVAASDLAAQTYPGRVLVLLTDGHNVRSLATLDEAVRAARQAGVVVYPIALGNAYPPPLRRLARATGGTFYSSATPANLDAIYRRIGRELGHTWRLTYPTQARPGESVSVSVGAPAKRQVAVVMPGRSSGPAHTLLPSLLVHGLRSVALLLLLVGVLFWLAATAVRRLPRAARVKQLVLTHTEHRENTSRQPGKRPSWATFAAALDRRFSGIRQWSRVERLIETAAVPISATTAVVAGIVIGLLLAILGGIASGSVFIGLLLFGLGVALPFIVIRVIARRRISAFEKQLPDVLATIAGSLRVGHGLKAALQTVAAEGAPPMSIELRRVLAEERLGRPLEEALVAMCERLASDDLLYVASAVEVQSQVGGSVAGVFTTVADTVRQRQQHRRKVQAVTSMGRATATVLAILPFVFVVLVLILDPGYMLPFLRSNTGHILMLYSVVSITIGFLILNRLVNVKR
jgi:tight adherence protein B